MATIRKLKSGSYQALIRLSGLKPITKSFPTKTQAKEFVRKVEGYSGPRKLDSYLRYNARIRGHTK